MLFPYFSSPVTLQGTNHIDKEPFDTLQNSFFTTNDVAIVELADFLSLTGNKHVSLRNQI